MNRPRMMALQSEDASLRPNYPNCGKPVSADVDVAATAALTAILGRKAIYRKQVVAWVITKVGRVKPFLI